MVSYARIPDRIPFFLKYCTNQQYFMLNDIQTIFLTKSLERPIGERAEHN
jgi:hypothetical protein